MTPDSGSAARESGASEENEQVSTKVTEPAVADTAALADIRVIRAAAVRMLVICDEMEDEIDGPPVAA